MTEVFEGHAVEVSNEPADIVEINPIIGDTPFMLVVETGLDSGNLGIDLDSPWTTTHAHILRTPGTWWLVHKETQAPVMALVVEEGDQPYFTKHHVGNLMTSQELVAYGMGKKCADGTMVRAWLLPNGIVCAGDDVDIIASRMLNG